MLAILAFHRNVPIDYHAIPQLPSCRMPYVFVVRAMHQHSSELLRQPIQNKTKESYEAPRGALSSFFCRAYINMKQARGAYVSWQLPKFASRNRIGAENVSGWVRQKPDLLLQHVQVHDHDVQLPHFPIHAPQSWRMVWAPSGHFRRGSGSEYNTLGKAGERGFPNYVLERKRGWRSTEHGGGASGGYGGGRGGLSAGYLSLVGWLVGYLLQLALVFRPRGV